MIQLTDPWTDLPLTFRFDAGPSVHSFPPLRAAPVLGGHLRRIIKVVYTAARTQVSLSHCSRSRIRHTATTLERILPLDDDNVEAAQVEIHSVLPQDGMKRTGGR